MRTGIFWLSQVFTNSMSQALYQLGMCYLRGDNLETGRFDQALIKLCRAIRWELDVGSTWFPEFDPSFFEFPPVLPSFRPLFRILEDMTKTSPLSCCRTPPTRAMAQPPKPWSSCKRTEDELRAILTEEELRSTEDVNAAPGPGWAHSKRIWHATEKWCPSEVIFASILTASITCGLGKKIKTSISRAVGCGPGRGPLALLGSPGHFLTFLEHQIIGISLWGATAWWFPRGLEMGSMNSWFERVFCVFLSTFRGSFGVMHHIHIIRQLLDHARINLNSYFEFGEKRLLLFRSFIMEILQHPTLPPGNQC